LAAEQARSYGEPMRLFGFSFSPYVKKVRRCLELKGLPCDYVEVPYLDRRELLALTGGYVHVPVLEEGGRVVTDSARITACIEAWARDAEALNRRASELLQPLALKVKSQPFLLGATPSLADVAVYGQLSFLDLASPRWVVDRAAGLVAWVQRVAEAG
jgi:glutathione S-transferase